MQKLKNFVVKNWVWLALAVIMVGAIFVRTYKFDDWLYFKMDQSRDALLISNAVENGPQYLPLLGARAGAVALKHGFLRLGPIFYYFQYSAGVLFHSTQAYVYAYPDLFFSLLAIPLLYALVRLYFSQLHALLIVAMYAFSFLIIQYSRFAWNPNSLQFFLLLSFYGLLRFLNEPDAKRQRKWLALWAAGMTIGSQLHFFGFFSLVGISGLLLIFHFQLWRKTQWQTCLQGEVLKRIAWGIGVVVLVFAIFYTPVFISEAMCGGQNTKNFFEAIGSKPANKPLTEKLAKTVTENLKYYCLLTTSQCYGGSLSKEIPALSVTGLILLAGALLVGRKLRSKTLTTVQRDFLVLLTAWVVVFTILTVPVAFQLRPRFFIVVFAVPFICLGLLFEYLKEKLQIKQAIAISILTAAAIITWNSYGTYAWFKEQAKSQKSSFIVKRTLILKAKDGVTLGQLQGVTDWMYGRRQAGATLYYYVKPEHVRPLEFLFSNKHDAALKVATMTTKTDPQAQFFAVTPTKNELAPVTKKFGEQITAIASKQFGQLTVFELNFPNRTVVADYKFNKAKTKTDRVFWKDVLGLKDDSAKIIQIDGAE
ncbi:MAG: phospholipid carrier-dependent glycosyltransferase, partial [Candidatus Moraniibacteriota bacterium]